MSRPQHLVDDGPELGDGLDLVDPCWLEAVADRVLDGGEDLRKGEGVEVRIVQAEPGSTDEVRSRIRGKCLSPWKHAGVRSLQVAKSGGTFCEHSQPRDRPRSCDLR